MLCVTANWRELVDQPADGGQISPLSDESEGGKDCVAKSADSWKWKLAKYHSADVGRSKSGGAMRTEGSILSSFRRSLSGSRRLRLLAPSSPTVATP